MEKVCKKLECQIKKSGKNSLQFLLFRLEKSFKQAD